MVSWERSVALTNFQGSLQDNTKKQLHLHDRRFSYLRETIKLFGTETEITEFLYLPRTSCAIRSLTVDSVFSPLVAKHEYIPLLEELRWMLMVLLVSRIGVPSFHHSYSQPQDTSTLQVKVTISPTYMGFNSGSLLSVAFGMRSKTQRQFTPLVPHNTQNMNSHVSTFNLITTPYVE